MTVMTTVLHASKLHPEEDMDSKDIKQNFKDL